MNIDHIFEVRFCGKAQTMPDLARAKRRQEKLRDKMWDRAARWKVIQETIAWAESQKTCRRNTPARCIEEERRKLRRRKPSSHSQQG
jgi:hypothetical protein